MQSQDLPEQSGLNRVTGPESGHSPVRPPARSWKEQWGPALRSLLERLDTPLFPLLFTALAYALFLTARLAVLNFDPSLFVLAGDRWCNPEEVPSNLTVHQDSTGYDGEFYYRLALNPFTAKATEFGITLDIPAHRQQRIMYPLIVWALSLGRAEWVPALLIGVNYAALCLLGLLGGYYARALKLHPAWGLLFPLCPGFVLTLSRDCVEIVAIGFMLAGLLAASKEKPFWAGALLSLAVLTRETMLIVPLAILMERPFRVWKGKRFQREYAYFLPLVVYGVWQLLLRTLWGQFSFQANRARVGMPFYGAVRSFFEYTRLTEFHDAVCVVEMALIVIFALAVASAIRSSSSSLYFIICWLFYTVLISTLTGDIWDDEWNFMRAITEFYVFGGIILLTSTSRMRLPVLGAWATLWAYLMIVRTGLPRLGIDWLGTLM